MCKILIRFVFLIIWFLHLDCEVHQDRPRIKTDDGDLVIEPAFDKNIYLKTNGPKSTVFVGGINLLKVNITDSSDGQYQPTNNYDFDRYLNGANGILQRLERLESREIPSHDFLLNLTILWRRVNRLTTRVTNLQNAVNNRGRDDCASRPCLNGGTCLNLINGFHCLCPSNWEGQTCETDVNECRNFAGTDLGCQNGAGCKNLPGSYECECRNGWLGVHCTRRNKDCSGGDYEMCGHGTCISVNTGEGIKCICHQGWTTNGTGVACLTDVNECDASQGPRCSVNPRVECINLPGSFRCGQCPRGYEGDGYICSDIDECLTIPNGGCSTSPLVTCHNTIGSRICGSCPPGYLGDGISCTWRGSCNINRGGCHPSAQCIENPALGGQMAQCVCPPGMDGDGIGIHGCYVSTGNFTRGCETNPCGVYGQCHPLRNGYTCICYRGHGGAHCDMASNFCASNPCLNGGSCRSDESSARGFRCECTAQYTGDLCHVVAKTCGGLLQAEEGSIYYPLSNTTYNHNSRCAWVIQTDRNKVINVTFTKFNLESNPECLYDFLQIHDGRSSASQIIGRFCGSEFPEGGHFISSHNNLYFWFRSDQTVAKDGFALHWTSIDPVCGGEINATVHGHISSPGSPGKYPPNRDCYWHLSTTLGKRIQLHFFALDIEVHSNCSFDYLVIYDGEHSTDPMLSKYCNSSQPAPIQSAGSDLLIHFHSDAYGSGYGFQLAYAPADGVPGCGGFYTEDKGELVSPSYNGKYLSNLLCEYKIKTQPGTQIRITFKSFKLESSFRCIYDYLKVYDGPSQDSRLVGKFCGSTYPQTYTSSTNEIYIKFKTDHSLATEGFRINYETVCYQTILGDSGVIKSPGYPLNYPKNRVCEYLIGTAPGKALQLTFQDFDIEDNNYYNCRYDFVEIRDGTNVNATVLGRYCGGIEHTPPALTSTHNYMHIKFSSDMSLSGRGFYANYTSIDIECGGIYRENTGVINHPSGNKDTYANDQKCTWLLIAPQGMHIKLSWNRFDIENSGSCTIDYVEISEVDDNNEYNILGNYCGTTTPPSITTTTNQLKIYFESDSSIRNGGFSLSYTFLDDRTHCGGTYTKAHGYLNSPGWPKRYEHNRDCIWTIVAPVGQQIKLNISQFHLERPIRDSCTFGDYLEIRNGATQSAPLVGMYCGTFTSKRIISMANTLYLHFHSDSYISGGGFQIEWDSTATGCGGTLTSPSGYISSPNYPGNYPKNAECFYKIVTSAGSRIRITFTDLELERTQNCRDDYVQVFDGRDSSSTSLGKYCFLPPGFKAMESSSNNLYIKFRSDFFNGGKGFMLQYFTICQHNLTGLHGVIESPGYPGTYTLNLNCLWTISVPKGNKINVTFTQFDVYKHNRLGLNPWAHGRGSVISTCAVDYLQIKESSDVNFGEKLCGQTLPKRISSNTNSLQIKFVTAGFTIPRLGFRLEWARFGCGGYIKKRYGSLELDSIKVSSEPLECEWIIESVPGSTISLSIVSLYMSDSTNCTIDAIEIYNGKSTSDPLLSKICHRIRNAQITSVLTTTNFMLVRFVKNSSLKDVQFKTHYDSYRTGCGGRIEALSGVIHSPNYPTQNYDNNVNCMWTLSVPRNHRIELNFMDFDLYFDSNSDTEECEDSIRIYDGNFVLNSNYTQRICPNAQVSQIISKQNLMGIQFLTNNEYTAKGFKANFTVTCGAVINATYDGIISNDEWHATHLTHNCTWTIMAPTPDKKISLTITHMSIPIDRDVVTNRKCPSNYLRVYDGEDDGAPVVEEYCGRKVPPMIVSQGSAMTIMLGAYNGTIQGQFVAHYSTLASACGGTLTSEEGSIASPNYPLSYPVSSSCEWTLSTSPGNRVYITFEQFDLEFSENCNQDYLEVREENGAGRLLGVYCGTDLPTNTTVGTQLYIKFHSDNQNGGRGFVIHYGFLHGNEITGLQRGEITSPLFPHKFEGAGEYTWRISTDGPNQVINLIVDEVEIPTQGLNCYNNLIIYDGFDADAPVLSEFCGLIQDTKELKTTSNIAFIKLTMDESNTGSLFHIGWANDDTYMETTSSNVNCGSNETEVILPGQTVTIQSPGYPTSYQSDLNCEWVFRASPGRHINFHFKDIKIEETPMCFADSLSIYSSNTPSIWKPIKENICTSEEAKEDLNATNYMRVVFKTDSSFEREGFEAEVSSLCGGFVTDLSGVVKPIWNDTIGKMKIKCDWTIKVRPGRVIKLSFDQFNISSVDNECKTFVAIRNGDSAEAPMLGNGKYCGFEHENRRDIESSSNAVFVSYSAGLRINSQKFQSFSLRYEEKGVECGATATLDADHNWEVINSPNYPSVPIPYSECVWVFTGPPGEILRLDFIDRFDLDRRDDCSLEYVEVRDGSTDLSPLIGQYCRDKPSTIKTSSNIMYMKYYTQVAEPRNGFKANISIDICGGTIRASKGEVISPGYPHLQAIPYGSVCEWRVIGVPRQIFLIKPEDIQLPESETPCGTKITIEETMPVNKTITVLETYCSDDEDEYDDESDLSAIETSSNEFIIKLRIGTPSQWASRSSNRGFKFSFNSSRPACGGEVTTSDGYLITPGYPRETLIRYCQWRIRVPDKSRRVRLELIDAETEKHRIGLYNDFTFQTTIGQIVPNNNTEVAQVFESSGNTMAIYVWLETVATRHRFKAKFSSDEPAMCGGTLTTTSLLAPDLDRSYTCEWQYKYTPSSILNNPGDFNTLFVTAKVNSSSTRSYCRYSDPRLEVRSTTSIYPTMVVKSFCGSAETSFRIPSTVMTIKATKNKGSYLDFNLQWKVQPCGGVVHVGDNAVNVLNVPSNYNDTLDCAWIVVLPYDNKMQMKLEGTFKLDCENEYVKIGMGLNEKLPVIGDYCKDKMQETPLITRYRFLLVQYHSNIKTNTSITLMAKTVEDLCGGILTEYQNVFETPHFPKNYDPNLECVWEITSSLGNKISLQFIERFAIEERTNCTKDAVIIYDWKDSEYTEIGKVCGRTIPPVFNSTLNRMKVVLRTDADVQLDGFKAQWLPICGGTFNATAEEQFLYSPGYPNQYLPNIDCAYEILGNNQRINITFLEFEMEGTYPSCEFDNLTLIAQSDYDVFEAFYCGSELPPPTHKYEKVTLTLKTDSYIQRKGFRLSYSLYKCGGNIKEPTVIRSSADGNNYESGENCTWLIEAPTDKIVVVKFREFNLEMHAECSNDYVALFNGLEINYDNRLALMCGQVGKPMAYYSSNNSMVLQFVTDTSISYKGFKAEIFFSYSSAVGCGGHINLTTTKFTLKSPLIAGSAVYENYLECQWTIKAPEDYVIKIEFKSFHIASCEGVNQTALGFSKCDCDYVEIKDGLNPNDLVIGTYCGHTFPPQLVSSGNQLSIRLSTDGELQSSGFEVELSARPAACGHSMYTASRNVQSIKSPGFDSGSIPRGLHCAYSISCERYETLHLTVKNLNVRPGDPEPHQCNKDKLVIQSHSSLRNQSVGSNFVLNPDGDYFSNVNYYYYEQEISHPSQYIFCGSMQDMDLYLTGSVTINLITTSDSDSLTHKGMELQFVYGEFCGRNYTERQGRIRTFYETLPRDTLARECFTLITAPENYTISVYFMQVTPDYWNDDVYLDVFDGNTTSATKLIRIQNQYDDNLPVFSTGQYILLHNHLIRGDPLTYDLIYVQTDKGRGCGGKINNLLGKVTSPLYPSIYRQKGSCEWVIETTAGTKVRLHFTVFDLGRACSQNYLQLVDRNGKTISTYCEETPADYTSPDNYVKIVFTTTMNNGGTGWVADFFAVL